MFPARRAVEETQQVDRFVGKLLSERYRVIRKIGEGGMGTVYEAFHETIEKKIALKVLHAQYSASPEVVHRFKQEAVSASRMKHQNVIDVFDFGQLGDGSCFIAMEYLDGMDLGDALVKRGHFTPDAAIRITLQMCRALGLGHGRGVVHRDLKPENVFLQKTEEGEELVKIVDFGIAQLRVKDDDPAKTEIRQRRLTKTGMIFGTPEYMAPEQARGQAIDQRSDIYSTGVILYELLTGAVPFLGESFLEVLNQHVQSRVPTLKEANANVELSPELERAVMRALEKDPEDRYPTMKDFSVALLKTPEGRAVRARISSIDHTDEPEDGVVAARIENSRIPRPEHNAGTAIFGSSKPAVDGALEGEVEIPTHSSKGLVFVGLGVLVLAAALGGYFFLGRAKGEVASADPPPPVVAHQAKAIAEQKTPVSAAPPVEEPAVPAPAAAEVVLHVVTVPEGAVVKKDGFQVCDAAPCDVVASPGEAITLVAEKGTLKGEAKVLAQKEQSVSITLVAPQAVPRPGLRPAPQAAPSPALCEVMVDGIKILRPCN